MENKTEKISKNTASKIVITILLVLLLILGGIVAYMALSDGDDKTAIITNADESLTNVDDSNELRVKMNTSLRIAKDTIQDLQFYNLNKDRYMECKIRLDGEDSYVYESPMIKEGEVIAADIIDTKDIKEGTNKAVAEVYAYNMDKNLTKQTNINITLILAEE